MTRERGISVINFFFFTMYKGEVRKVFLELLDLDILFNSLSPSQANMRCKAFLPSSWLSEFHEILLASYRTPRFSFFRPVRRLIVTQTRLNIWLVLQPRLFCSRFLRSKVKKVAIYLINPRKGLEMI